MITEMHRILRLQSQLFGYHDPKGNPRGMCSLLTWTEILHMFLCLKDPFVHNCLNAYNSILKYCPRADDPLLILQKQNHKRNVKSNLEKIRIITKHYKKKTAVENVEFGGFDYIWWYFERSWVHSTSLNSSR